MSERTILDPRTHVGAVSLAVADLARSLRFYGDVLGMQPAERDHGSALLAAGATPLVHLMELPGARPKPARATGLYHFALLLPSRPRSGPLAAPRAGQRLAAAGLVRSRRQ
jgi:catechol 2,3-dioxygenase